MNASIFFILFLSPSLVKNLFNSGKWTSRFGEKKSKPCYIQGEMVVKVSVWKSKGKKKEKCI